MGMLSAAKLSASIAFNALFGCVCGFFDCQLRDVLVIEMTLQDLCGDTVVVRLIAATNNAHTSLHCFYLTVRVFDFE